MKRYVEPLDRPSCDGSLFQRESAELYSCRCTVTALSEMLDEHQSRVDAPYFAGVAEVFANPLLEPFAFVVSAAFVDSVVPQRESAVSVSHKTALPLAYASLFEPENESGSR